MGCKSKLAHWLDGKRRWRYERCGACHEFVLIGFTCVEAGKRFCRDCGKAGRRGGSRTARTSRHRLAGRR